jgi:hypothetical protein
MLKHYHHVCIYMHKSFSVSRACIDYSLCFCIRQSVVWEGQDKPPKKVGKWFTEGELWVSRLCFVVMVTTNVAENDHLTCYCRKISEVVRHIFPYCTRRRISTFLSTRQDSTSRERERRQRPVEWYGACTSYKGVHIPMRMRRWPTLCNWSNRRSI